MKTRQEIFSILSEHLGQLRSDFGVGRLGIFGSVLRDEHTSASDIDILVEFAQKTGMVEFLRLEYSLQELLDAKVDLVTPKALKEHVGRRILSEVRFVS